MAMSRKDYVAFAAMLADRRKYADSRDEHMLLDTITGEMATIFGRDNGRFNRQRFYTAAGYDSPQAEAARVEPEEPDVYSDPQRRALLRRSYG
jgi:hypothetical protein